MHLPPWLCLLLHACMCCGLLMEPVLDVQRPGPPPPRLTPSPSQQQQSVSPFEDEPSVHDTNTDSPTTSPQVRLHNPYILGTYGKILRHCNLLQSDSRSRKAGRLLRETWVFIEWEKVEAQGKSPEECHIVPSTLTFRSSRGGGVHSGSSWAKMP